MMTSNRFVPSRIKNLLRSDDAAAHHIAHSGPLAFTQNFASNPTTHIPHSGPLAFPQNFASNPTTPTVTKKLLRSRHTIDTSLIPAVLDKYDAVYSPRSPAVSIASRKSVDIIKEHHKVLSRKSWISGEGHESMSVPHSGEIDMNRRKSCDIFRPGRFNGDSNRSEHTFSKRDINSGRSSAWDSASSDEDQDLSMSWASFQSLEDDADEALEFADAEERFLQSYPNYAATATMDYIRRDQYPKLARHVYMDYASLALSSRFQMEEHMRLVMAEGQLFGANSATAAEYAASSLNRLLQLLNTTNSEYSIVFTTGLKAAYRLVANAYPFQKGSPILLCQDNHDAVSQVTMPPISATWRPNFHHKLVL